VANRTKYGKNRQLWRRTYGTRRRKPDIAEFVDPVTETTVSYDLNRTLRHRDYFIIKTFAPLDTITPTPTYYAEYDEGLISFSGTDSAILGFNFCFGNTPDAVVLTVEGSASGDNSNYIIPYGITFNSCSMSIGLSAPYVGDIRYRAVYSTQGYPVLAVSVLEPASGNLLVYAGVVSGTAATSYTASYSGLGSVPSTFYKTPWDTYSNFDVDVNITQETATTVATSGEISAPLSSPIHFIAVQ